MASATAITTPAAHNASVRNSSPIMIRLAPSVGAAPAVSR
jgi:hypothetical protein